MCTTHPPTRSLRAAAPRVQAGNVGPTQTLEEQTRYINFYGNLMKLSDSYLVRSLPLLPRLHSRSCLCLLVFVRGRGKLSGRRGPLASFSPPPSSRRT